MDELTKAIERIDGAQLGGESLDDEPEYRAVELVTNIARMWLNPNIEAVARLLADHRGVDWADTTYMDACRRMAEQYVAAALTPGDTHELSTNE